MSEKTQIRGIDIEKYLEDLNKMEDAEKEEELKQLAIKERLILGMYLETETITFQDGLGTFDVEVYTNIDDADMKTLLELAEAIKDQQEGKSSEIMKSMIKVNKLLAKVTVDPELDEEYWIKGKGYTTNFALDLLFNAMAAQQENMQSFRRERTGTITIGGVQYHTTTPKPTSSGAVARSLVSGESDSSEVGKDGGGV